MIPETICNTSDVAGLLAVGLVAFGVSVGYLVSQLQWRLWYSNQVRRWTDGKG